MVLEGVDAVPLREVPHLDGVVGRRRDEVLLVRREVHTQHPRAVAAQRARKVTALPGGGKIIKNKALGETKPPSSAFKFVVQYLKLKYH